jgi:hypothetical protein
MRGLVAALLAAIALAGCSPMKDVPAAETAIAVFHQNLNNQAFDAIYVGAGPELGRRTSQADFVRLLSAINRKLGNFQSGSANGWNDNVTPGGHYLTISYAAKYERGAADENFVYRLDGARPLLVGYHINSMALITN